jgi:hypothetical protein
LFIPHDFLQATQKEAIATHTHSQYNWAVVLSNIVYHIVKYLQYSGLKYSAL